MKRARQVEATLREQIRGQVTSSGLSLRSAAEELPPPRDLRASRVRLHDVEFLIVEHAASEVALPDVLSGAERRIIPLLARGLRVADIATACGVSKRTVDNQLASIYQKLEVSSREELIAHLIG